MSLTRSCTQSETSTCIQSGLSIHGIVPVSETRDCLTEIDQAFDTMRAELDQHGVVGDDNLRVRKNFNGVLSSREEAGSVQVRLLQVF